MGAFQELKWLGVVSGGRRRNEAAFVSVSDLDQPVGGRGTSVELGTS